MDLVDRIRLLVTVARVSLSNGARLVQPMVQHLHYSLTLLLAMVPAEYRPTRGGSHGVHLFMARTLFRTKVISPSPYLWVKRQIRE
jgi:hypothetical protein